MKSLSKSQWQCIQENIGTWHGSFTQFSPEGEQVKDTPSVLTLEETEPDKKMKLTLERTPSGGSPDITRREFSAPGPAPYVYFFESGAFSQGSAQWAAFRQFGAEMSIKVGDRRARFVIMYEGATDGTSQLKYVTLIRETQAGGTKFTEPEMTIAQLQGEWTGAVSALNADMSPATTGKSQWILDSSALACQSILGETTESLHLTTSAEMLKQPLGRIAQLQGNLRYQLMSLPNGAYCLLPQTIEKELAFQVEAGWLRVDGSRSRLIRYYDSRGVWVHTALIEDQRQ